MQEKTYLGHSINNQNLSSRSWTSLLHHSRVVIKTARKQGLSDVQLKKLPKIVGNDLSLDINDCAICLDVIGNKEFARLVPGCKHGECVDLWLSKQPFCLFVGTSLSQSCSIKMETIYVKF
ncbi:hypothetical protein RDI58_020141 [Solanum bulbocastanum]|uniref:RING-type domain-containing protein n=1 Tax=Solanum bulbocastanum TaxID=147425 RepID=A0AAN8T626_SOLBU